MGMRIGRLRTYVSLMATMTAKSHGHPSLSGHGSLKMKDASVIRDCDVTLKRCYNTCCNTHLRQVLQRCNTSPK